jgi:hypothetical protein
VQSATVLVREFDGEILAIEQDLRALEVLLGTFRYPENHTDSARQGQSLTAKRGASVPLMAID